ncbi:MAG: RNA polymerase-associated protein RapA [Opitutales bacterium]
MTVFRVGQRWISETEPELGLGVVESVEGRQVRLFFRASNETRLYASANAPIKRVAFRVGDSVQSESGVGIVIDEVREQDGLLTYVGDGVEIFEADLADTISFSKPEDRLIAGRTDRSASFALRYETIERRCVARQSEVMGLMGGRIDLIPHQLYIASEVAERYRPRVLLADEVGLGKTIEACLILHRLHLTGRAERILIILPESLVHQWFVELLRRFNLWFALFDASLGDSMLKSDEVENPFLEEQLVICSIETLLSDERWAAFATEAEWDMLVVDEAHHLEWMPGNPSPAYQLVERLAQKSGGLLLLTATPEQLGAEGHFARLRLLDPERYPDLERFKSEQADYTRVAAVADKLLSGRRLTQKDRSFLQSVFEEFTDEEFEAHMKDGKALLEELVDRHGTGRVLFRNTRETLDGFPEREAVPAPLAPRKTLSEEALQERLLREFDLETDPLAHPEQFDFRHGPRIRWLADLLRKLEGEKVLLICRTKEKVLAIHEALGDELNVKAAVFHEGLTLIQRDRNAAWFADAEGAKILMCSEIGSEGRNFQFARHLVLFDLPLNPELLEQRIGRLDRIGQKNTVTIHLPFLKQSCTELLVRWHHEGLDDVKHSLKGGYAYLEKFGDKIRELGPVYHHGEARIMAEADRLVENSQQFRKELERKLKEGQDRLVAMNSFRREEASRLVEAIRAWDEDRTLDQYMNRIFDHFGVTVEDVGDRTYHLSRGQMFTDAFPSLPEEGTTVTSDRDYALSREDIGFLSWDHPMVGGAMDLMLSSEQGNSSIVTWTNGEEGAPSILVEAVFVLESVAPRRLHVDRFLPPTPVRALVDMEGSDHSETFSHAKINKECRDEEAFRVRQNPELLQALVPEMLKSARNFARERKSVLVQHAMQVAHTHLDGEANRLRELRKVNPSVREEEIRLAEKVVAEVTRHIARARLRLDAVRLVLASE